MKRIIMLALLCLCFSASGFSQALSEARFADLADIEPFVIPDSAGTIFLIPQKHRGVGSELILNDESLAIARIQEQVSGILLLLHAEPGVSRVLVEADLYFQQTENMNVNLRRVAETKRSLDLCRAVLDEELALISSYPLLSPEAKQTLADTLTKPIREKFSVAEDLSFFISGPYWAHMESAGQIQLWGGEDRELNARAEQLAIRFAQISERLEQLAGTSNRSLPVTVRSSASFLPSGSILGVLFSELPADHPLRVNTQKLDDCLAVLPSEDAVNLFMPMPALNPFFGITDRAALARMREIAEKEFDRVSLDERDTKAAQLAGRMMKESGQKFGAVVFGSDHKPGLVKHLTEAGYSVIVVTPKLLLPVKQ